MNASRAPDTHSLNALGAVVTLLVLGAMATPTYAQIDALEVSIQGLSGRQTAFPGDEVVIYTVELNNTFGNGITSDLGELGGNEGIELIINDLSAATGLVSKDIAELRLYNSANSTFDGSDTQVASNSSVVIGGVTLLDVSAAAAGDKVLPEDPATIFFIATAVIAEKATKGHAFTLSTLAPHVGVEESAGGVDGEIGSAIVASDADIVVIIRVAPTTLATGGLTIPFGGEPATLCLLLATGVFALWRRP